MMLILSIFISAPVVLAVQEKPPEGHFEAGTLDRSPLLLRDPAVQKELGLTRDKTEMISQWMDAADGSIWTCGNLTPAQAQAKLRPLLADLRRNLNSVLTVQQQNRFTEMALQWQGLGMALTPELRKTLKLTADQESRIQAVVEGLPQAFKQSASQGGGGRGQEEAVKAVVAAANRKMCAVLTDTQKKIWERLTGPPFDFSKVRPLALKAPELRQGEDWINSKALTMSGLRGHVVVLHFFTFGCINCIHNYPAYKAWTDSFAAKGVTILGIHTPETQGEREIEKVRVKVRENGLKFPILVDNERQNWKVWGNSMWPAVYLVDKRGYVRQTWFGELNWQGAKGQELMTQAIQGLLVED